MYCDKGCTRAKITKAGKACAFRHNLANMGYQKSSEKEGNPWDKPVNPDNYWSASTVSLWAYIQDIRAVQDNLLICPRKRAKLYSFFRLGHSLGVFTAEGKQNPQLLISILVLTQFQSKTTAEGKQNPQLLMCILVLRQLQSKTTAEGSTSVYLSACEDVSRQFHFCKVPLADCLQQSVVSDVRLFICTGSYWVSTPSSRAPGSGGDFLPPVSMWSVLKRNVHKDKEMRGHAVLPSFRSI